MRLLESQNDGHFRFTDDLLDNELPAYAILSHTWGQDGEEVAFEDLMKSSGPDKAGLGKIKFCAKQAAKDGLRFFWVDTCCINKSSHSELSQAINSMFRWYRGAARCYVYLSDVSTRKRKERDQISQNTWEPAFRESRWFTRGWTLQELLAPASVEFFSNEHERLGDKQSLMQEIHEITGIPISAIEGRPLPDFSIEERMSWAAKRNTKHEEDKAYSLLGIFGVHMSPMYGEGMHNARNRLREEIREASLIADAESLSMFVKTGSNSPDVSCDLSPPTKKKLLETLRFDQIDDRFLNIKPPHIETCRWLLGSTEYLDWMSADKLSVHHGFFWIRGKPGSGKSTLTKFALMGIKESLRNTTLLSFFFNARGSRLEKNTLRLYRSLLVQWLEKSPNNQINWNFTSLNNRRLDSQLKTNSEMLKQILARAIQLSDQHSITIVIDALDECDEDEVRDMVSFFEMLGEDAISDGRTLRVLFSSRHYPHITIQRSVEMKLEHQSGHSQDIEKYLYSELKIGQGKKAEQLRQEVRDRSSGIFMWIILVVPILNKAFDHGQVRTLQKKLREIPSDLTELFRTILTRENENLEEMKLCLQWVLFANRPLQREELYYAILSGTEPDDLSSWDPETISTETMDLSILSCSKGLAEVTKSKHNVVQFIHESVRDFLLKENGLGQLWADLEANCIGLSQDRLKECCLNYMRSTKISDLDVDGSLPLASSPQAAVLRKNASLQFPFLEYAVHNVFVHADSAHAERVSQESFMKDTELSNWIQHNNVIERYGVRRLPPDIDLLYICAERNYCNLIGILMQHGLYTRRQNGRYHNPIFAAIANKNHQAFEALIRADSQSYPLRTKFPYPGKNIGSFLVKHGTSTIINRFISVYNYDITSTFRRGGTILIWAAEKGHTKTVELLISHGADVNARDGKYRNALYAASNEGHEEVIEILLSHGADINAQGGHYGNALQAASFKGHEKIIEILLSHSADINAQGGHYGNALQAASFKGHEKIIEILLSHSADINAQGGFYGNALQAASAEGHEKIVEILLSHGGANVNAQGGFYGNALQAASAEGHEKITKILLSHGGADVNAQGGFYGNALQAASLGGYEKVIEMLLSYDGVDVNAQGGYYGNALQAASLGGYEKAVEMLLSYGGVDVYAQGGYYGNALQAASAKGHKKIVEMLLSPDGVDVNVQIDGDDDLSEAMIQGPRHETPSEHSNQVQTITPPGSLSPDELANLDDSGTRSSLQQSNGSCTTTNLGVATSQMPLNLEAVRQWNEKRLYCREELRSRTAYKNLAFASYHEDPSLVEAFSWLIQESEVRLPLHVRSMIRDFLDRSWTNDEHLLALQGFANLAISYASVKDAVSSGMTDEGLTYLAVESNRSNVAEFVSFEMIHLVNYVSRLGRLLRFPQLHGTERDHWGFSYHAVVQGLEDSEWHLETLSLSAFWEATEDFLAASKLHIIWPQKTAATADSYGAGVQAVAMTMQTIANMIELIGIATLDGHTGSLWNAVTEAETLQIELPSASIPDGAMHEIRAFYSARHFDCLNDFTGGQPVWVLHSASVDTTNKLYLSVFLDDFAKVWGPAWAVHDPSEPSEIHEIRIRLGILVPQEHRLHVNPPLQNGEKLAHWTIDNLPSGTSCQELSITNPLVVSNRQPTATPGAEVIPAQSASLVLHFRYSDRLLIGACTHSPKLRRRSCHCSSSSGEIEDRLNRKGLIHRLGTCRPYRYRHSQQIGGTVGTYAAIGANSTYIIDPGQSLSQILLAGWENDPRSRHTSELENYCGLVISACTLNALRVRYVDLLNTPTMRRHLKLYQWKVETCKSEFYRALKSERPRALTALWETHPEWQDELGEILLFCMRVLSKTGYDARRNELEVLWISEGDPLPWAISLRTKDHNWIGSLRDEQCSMAATVLIEESLYTRRSHSRTCGDDSKHTVLETAYVMNENAKGFRDLTIISGDDAAETHPWRSPDHAWERVWSVKKVPTVFDGKLGRDFPTRCGSRLCALKRLTKTHLLARWSPQHFEFIRRPIFGPIAEPESECHWEQSKDLSDRIAHDLGTQCVRPLPLHIC